MKYTHIIRTYDILEQSVTLEKERYIIMRKIVKQVEIILKKYNITIGILARWLFSNICIQYKDPLFPYNANNNSQLKKDIEGQGQGHLYPEILKELDLCTKFNNAIIVLNQFISTPIYQSTKNQPIKMQIKGDWYSFIINDTNSNYAQIKPVHKTLYEKLKKNYINYCTINNIVPSQHILIALIISLVIRYEALESGNQQLAVNPLLYKRLEFYGFRHELFASGLNSYCDSYCSLFPDIEQYFGSKGNFDDFKMLSGKYLANPPFDEAITKNMSLKLIAALTDSKEYIAVFITLPAWDKFEALTLLEKSGFMTLKQFVPKNSIKYFHYYENKYIDAVNTCFILLENRKTNLNEAIRTDIKTIFANNKNKIGGYNNGFDNNGDIGLNKVVIDMNLNIAKSNNAIDVENIIPELANDSQNIIVEVIKPSIPHKIEDKLIVQIKNTNMQSHSQSQSQTQSLKGELELNIKYASTPVKYLNKYVAQFYEKQALANAKRLNFISQHGRINVAFSIENNITTILNEIFPEGIHNPLTNILLIDLTYSCEHFTFIKNRLRKNYLAITDFLLKTSFFQTIGITWSINPRYLNILPSEFIHHFSALSPIKLNFIFVSGNLDYYMSKSISFYTEQISYVLYLTQCYIILANQELGGSFIYFFYSCDTPIFRQMIAIFQNSYASTYLFNLFDNTNISYIIGKNFLGISDENLFIIKECISELLQKYPDFGESINIYSDELRKKYHVVKHITTIPKDIIYLNKVFKLDGFTPLHKIYRKINEFHNKKYGRKL